MVVELGLFSLIIALLLSGAQAWFGLAGPAFGNRRWMAAARPAVTGQWVFVAMSFGVLCWAFYKNDFSVLYVANNSNSELPTFYRFAAVWGAHEGSLLLWALALSTWSVAVGAFSKDLPETYAARLLGVLGVVSIGFQLFILLTSSPFERLFPAAVDGRDLNPLLQDPALAIHPPMLYIGYVGFSVAFAFAVAALLEGRLDEKWARWARPWTTLAWLFLTVGITLGSWWAYYELGWGGWWFWDPVENASFMPWLVGTALIHSLAVTEKRGLFKSWTLLLAITAFSLSLLGTFLVRSGVLVSVHAFASDPGRGLFILAFLGVCIGGSLALFAWRGPALRSRGGFETVSRESFILLQQPAAAGGRGADPDRHAVPAVPRRPEHGQDLGRAAVLQRRVPDPHAAAGVPARDRHALGLEEGEARGHAQAAHRAVRGVACVRGGGANRRVRPVPRHGRRRAHGRRVGDPVVAVRAVPAPAAQAVDLARRARHDGRAHRRRALCDRRHRDAELSRREGHRAASRATASPSKATISCSRARSRCRGRTTTPSSPRC